MKRTEFCPILGNAGVSPVENSQAQGEVAWLHAFDAYFQFK
jgi:hypothetical protein